MNEIKTISLSSMNNGAHFAFHSEVLKLIETDSNLNEKISKPINAYRKSILEEQKAIKVPQKSLYSDDVAKSDSERDALYRGLKNAVSAYAAVPNEDVKQSYKVLWQLIKDYNIKTTTQLDKTTGLLIKFIDELETTYVKDVKKLSLNNFVTLLKEANERLRTAISKRNEERSHNHKPAGALKQARVITDDNFKLVVKYINAYALIEGSNAYDGLINQINRFIDRYKVQVIKGRGQGNNNKSGETPSENKPTTE